MAAALLLLHRTMRTRRQFYLAVTYLQTSKLSYVVLGNAVIAFGVGLFGVVTSVFLDGGLRPNERDSIGENIRWDVTETCLALTIFRSELDVFTALEFLVLVVMKW
jgi:E3 ubiquitin-protein ligase synoviolin